MVQQPQLHHRTLLTWEKQTGRRPLGWTVRPTPAATGRSNAEMVKYAIGELKRIPDYADAEKGFCTMPADYPLDLALTVLALEPSVLAAVELEEQEDAREGQA